MSTTTEAQSEKVGTIDASKPEDALAGVVDLAEGGGARNGEARTNAAVSTNNNLRYIAGYYGSASGLYRLGARYDDTSLGRFT